MEQPADSAPRLYVHTLGCPKNEADSRVLARALARAGGVVVTEPGQSTHILVNTCGFIQAAKEESIAAILDACASYPDKKVLVMGCLVERYRDELRAGIPEVSGWFGLTDGVDGTALVRALTGGLPRAAEATGAPGETGPTAGTRARVDRAAPVCSYAYIKISDGCDEPCSFCAIPAIKGRYHSLSVDEILGEADACLGEGARELVLVGQDTTLWKSDGRDLAGLLDLLAADERVRRLRVMYLQPERVDDSFLTYMAGRSKLCRYLDVPFQHSHPEVLARMCRGGSGEAFLELLARARRFMPDVSVRTSLIVGFPGETEEQFEHLAEFVQQAAFDYAGGFVYSPEEGTPAGALRPGVRKAVAGRRLNRLNALLLSGAERKHQALVGARVEVMIDSTSPEECEEGVAAIGRTAGQAPEVDGVTYIEGELPEGVGTGDVVMVTLESAVGFDLVGRCDEA